MANYSEFNNNNYLPGLYNEMAATVFNNFSSVHRSPVLSQNSFTFTSPTQGITLATHRPSIQTTSPISNMSAPGVGTSWQHSIPVTMPWADVVNLRGAGTTTVFTGVPVPAFPELPQSVNVLAPVKCPKRKALDLPDEAPLSKVYLCADQFAHMTITSQDQSVLTTPSVAGDNTNVQVFFGSRESQCQSDASAWQRFREIENRLEVELDEDFDGNLGQTNNMEQDGPRLTIVDGILESTKRQSPILPRKVMEDITKPCMQIVLWKSPGELVREVAKEESQTKTSSSSTTTTLTNSQTLGTSASPADGGSSCTVNAGMGTIPESFLFNTSHASVSQSCIGTNFQSTASVSTSLPPSFSPLSSPPDNSFNQISKGFSMFETIDDDDMQL
ncbi:uncharacterized protein LOC106071345 isoform X1 [Biomphalaria glabrata]|uniref:Uncharacterized protein LOC106071345 isoform X1 n=1 Tax=Biomphalaria glabrata TaxID=6526 RepID=A0A9U8EGI8_BIOGL|nr:uncharacterized protein LOC106071345 isoform X1 [Biomphalaria glabrata]XP_013086886.2 uncharacterized protein LOC106071345 isoform X1 [Biomphalaria glabrata]XP_013086887.2 uncharacterized protein LOC106071345 isoform X1 [Biomphalaria glabrata]KAI8782861.1 serine/threonine-protein kinase ndrD [Biomphalaria glabrata]